MFVLQPMLITAVEWPIQVYFNLFEAHRKLGLLFIGRDFYNYSLF